MSSTALAVQWPLTGRYGEIELFERLLADPSCDGIVVHGPAGVGKTRLADEWCAVAERGGHRILRAVASGTASTVPLGAIAHLLPDRGADPVPGPVELFERVATAVRGDGDARVVLLIDDLHLLDATSLTLVSQLLASGIAVLVGTMRDGEVVPEAVATMWRSDRVRRLELGELSAEGVDTLLHLALGGPLDAASTSELWAISQGNVLFLRELVLGARRSGALAEVGGVWRLDGRVGPTRRLIELVESRIGDVDGDGRAVLDLLALCEPVGLADLEELAGHDVLDRLERDGHVVVHDDARRCRVVLGHPLHGEVLRVALTRVASRRILLAQSERTERRGLRRREDALRVAMWRLDAVGRADPGLLEQAARLARFAHDFAQVERLARSARLERPSSENALLLGEALYETGSFEEADDVLAAGSATIGPDDDPTLAHRLAHKRATNLFWGLLRADDAVAVVRAARSSASSPAARNELLAAEASTRMYGGDPAGALDLLDALEPGDELRTDVRRAIVESPALAVTGRTAEALAVARQGFDDHLRLGDQLAIAHPGTHVVAQVLALTEAGRLVEAAELARIGHDRAVADRVPIARIWFALNLGRSLLVQGRLRDALRWFREAAAVARGTGFVGPLRIALTGAACAAGAMADGDAADLAVVELDRLTGDFGFLQAEEALGRAWCAVATGRPQDARDLLAAAAVDAARSGHRMSEAWLLHDLVRLGRADAVAPRLADLADASDSALVAARARHASGLARGDPDDLDAAVDAFESMGALLLAAEAASAAADAHRRRGRTRPATSSAARSAALAAQCPGARTPGLALTTAVVPLSPREREICLLASDGMPSKSIAEQLFLSARTVNNHLQAAYSKLGISSREELAGALALEEEPRDT